MALVVIAEEEQSQNDVPWVNEYLSSFMGEEGDSTFVTDVRKTPKGLMVIGQDFKGFVFERSNMTGFLLEALEAWVSNSTINYPLYAIALSGGKINLAVENEEEPTLWTVDKSGRAWTQKRKKAQGSGLTTPTSNPLLPTLPPTSSGKKGK